MVYKNQVHQLIVHIEHNQENELSSVTKGLSRGNVIN